MNAAWTSPRAALRRQRSTTASPWRSRPRKPSRSRRRERERMRSTLLFYHRISSPLHATRAGVGVLWALALAVFTLLLFHPLALLALLLAVLCAGAGARVGAARAGLIRRPGFVCLPSVPITVLVSREGLAVASRLGDLGPFGQGNL